MKQLRQHCLRSSLAAISSALLLFGTASPVHASVERSSAMAAQGWAQPYASLTEQPLSSVLQAFIDDHALQLVVARDFKAKLEHAPAIRAMRADSAPAFLQQLAAHFPFNWFVYESKLYISSPSDYHAQRIGPLDGGLDRAHQALTEIGLLDPRFGWGELPDQSSVLVSGPTQYIALVRQMLHIGKPASPQPILMRFPLRYAPVDDRQVSGCGTTSVIPGVASLLTKLMTGIAPPFSGSVSLPPLPGGAGASTDSAAMGGSATNSSMPSYPQSLGFMGMGQSNAPLGNMLAGTPMNLAAAMPPPPNSQQAQARASINLVADVRGNAILVRDAASRRSYYQSLLDTLDVPAPTITIDLFSIEYDPSVQPLLDQLLASTCADGTCASNGTDGDRKTAFISQLTALSNAGKIEMVSRQRLITEDNQLVALTLERHFAGSESSPGGSDDGDADSGASAGGSSDGASAASRDTGDQFCVKPHQIDYGPDPVIELMLSSSLHEPIGALGETPESYTQRHLNTVLTLRSGIPILVETDTLVPKMARQRALILLVQPSQAGHAP